MSQIASASRSVRRPRRTSRVTMVAAALATSTFLVGCGLGSRGGGSSSLTSSYSSSSNEVNPIDIILGVVTTTVALAEALDR